MSTLETDSKFILYSTLNGAITILILTVVILIIQILSLVIHWKSNYRCPCFRLFITSVLMSTFISNLICFTCNIILMFIIYQGVESQTVFAIYHTNKVMTVGAEFVCILHIFLISFQRYIAVVYPFKINRLWVLCKGTYVCSIIWGVTLIIFIGLSILEFYTSTNILRLTKTVQGYTILVIILIMTYYYTRIIHTLVKRYRNQNLKTSSTNLRAVFISIALGVAFALSFGPKAIESIIWQDLVLTWTIYLYIISYSYDSLLIIGKFIYEKSYLKENRSNNSIKSDNLKISVLKSSDESK